MPRKGETGIVIPVPEADPLLDFVRERHPASVRDLPAHISVLYPFLDADDIDPEVINTITTIFTGRTPPIEVTFQTCERRSEFVYLPPEPADQLAALTSATRQHWPELLPYRGLYGDSYPHLTVAICPDETTAIQIQHEVVELIPLQVQLNEAWLLEYTDKWSLHSTFPFDDHRTLDVDPAMS